MCPIKNYIQNSKKCISQITGFFSVKCDLGSMRPICGIKTTGMRYAGHVSLYTLSTSCDDEAFIPLKGSTGKAIRFEGSMKSQDEKEHAFKPLVVRFVRLTIKKCSKTPALKWDVLSPSKKFPYHPYLSSTKLSFVSSL